MEHDQEIIGTTPVNVRYGDVDKELAGLWRDAIGSRGPGPAPPAARAIISNLVIYAASEADADSAMGAVNDVIAGHPSRVVVADSETGEPQAQAGVSMLCSISERGRHLCGESIRLHTHGMAAPSIGMILPVLVPDLPTYIWIPGDVVWDESTISALSHIADTWIIDSRQFSSLQDSLDTMLRFGPLREPPVAIHDLAWISLWQWREMIAQHFDSASHREYLTGKIDVTIEFASKDKFPSVESIFIAAWLANRLGWHISGAQNEANIWKIDAGANSITLQQQNKFDRAINKVKIESNLNGRKAEFVTAIEGSGEETSLEATLPDVEPVRRTMRLSPSSRSSDLGKALDAPISDKLYEQCQSSLRELLNSIKKD